MPDSKKSRLVTMLNKATKNELAYISLKNRMTMTAYLEACIHDAFMKEVPKGYSLTQALSAVAQDDFESGVTIPFGSN